MKEDKFLGILPISTYNINIITPAIVKDLREYIKLCDKELMVLEDNIDYSEVNMTNFNDFFWGVIQLINMLNKIQSIREGDTPYFTYQLSLIENKLPHQK